MLPTKHHRADSSTVLTDSSLNDLMAEHNFYLFNLAAVLSFFQA